MLAGAIWKILANTKATQKWDVRIELPFEIAPGEILDNTKVTQKWDTLIKLPAI
jgi:hypothetical protein